MPGSLLVAVAVLCLTTPARALDKQGSAHGGQIAGAESGFHVSGSAGIGVSPYNPTYAARPDASGHALMRYALHADIDLVGRRLSIPLDLNVFSDRDRSGALELAPSELDLIGGVTSTWGVGPGALELGLRAEHDRPVDRGTYTQTYVDFRTRALFSLNAAEPGVGRALAGGDVSGAATLGLFAFNPTYAARPDNSGFALFRYALRIEVSTLDSHLALAVDGTFFTDREQNAVRPSELDFTPEIIGRWDPFELHLAYERDMPLDRGGLVQHFVYLFGAWSFDTSPAEPGAEKAAGSRGLRRALTASSSGSRRGAARR